MKKLIVLVLLFSCFSVIVAQNEYDIYYYYNRKVTQQAPVIVNPINPDTTAFTSSRNMFTMGGLEYDYYQSNKITAWYDHWTADAQTNGWEAQSGTPQAYITVNSIRVFNTNKGNNLAAMTQKPWGFATLTNFAVLYPNGANANSQHIFGHYTDEGNYFYGGTDASGKFYISMADNAGHSATLTCGTVTVGSINIIAYQYNGTKLTVYQGGSKYEVSPTNWVANKVWNDGTMGRLGSHNGSTNDCDIDIGDFISFKTLLTVAQIDGVCQWLANRWASSWTNQSQPVTPPSGYYFITSNGLKFKTSDDKFLVPVH